MKRQIDYKAEVLKSVEEEYSRFRASETAKSPDEIFDDSANIVQFNCAYKMMKEQEFSAEVYMTLYSLRGYILEEIVNEQGNCET